MKAIIILIFSTSIFAQQTSFQLWVEGSDGSTEIKHEIGFNENATINHDIDLEVLIPPFDPPADSIAISSIVFYDENHEGDIWTRNHLQAYPENDQYFYEYVLRVYRRDITFSIKWDNIESIVDSAIIEDQSGLALYTANLLEDSELIVDNENVQNISFNLKVWYNLNKLSVENHSIDIYPNPSSDIINLIGYNQFNYKIFDIVGNEIDNGLSFDSKINISHLLSGQYLIEIQSNGKRHIEQFIKY